MSSHRTDGPRVSAPLRGFSGYVADDEGHIWSLKGCARRRLAEHPNTHGYLTVRLCVAGREMRKVVHALVCAAFHGERQPRHEARHINGIQHDNRPSNLTWGNARDNAADRESHGRTFKQRGRAGRFANAR